MKRSIDGTERPINRPKNKDDQKAYYSGKKKAHTVKNNVITERNGKVKYLSDTHEGKKHDKKIADEEGYRFPSGSKLLQDTGFQSYKPEGGDDIATAEEASKRRIDARREDYQLSHIKYPSRSRASDWWHQALANCGAEIP